MEQTYSVLILRANLYCTSSLLLLFSSLLCQIHIHVFLFNWTLGISNLSQQGEMSSLQKGPLLLIINYLTTFPKDSLIYLHHSALLMCSAPRMSEDLVENDKWESMQSDVRADCMPSRTKLKTVKRYKIYISFTVTEEDRRLL